jgi:hypothetical protein
MFEHISSNIGRLKKYRAANSKRLISIALHLGSGGLKGIYTTYEIHNTRCHTTSYDNIQISYAGSRRGSAEI